MQSPYRSLLQPLLKYIDRVDAERPDDFLLRHHCPHLVLTYPAWVPPAAQAHIEHTIDTIARETAAVSALRVRAGFSRAVPDRRAEDQEMREQASRVADDIAVQLSPRGGHPLMEFWIAPLTIAPTIVSVRLARPHPAHRDAAERAG